MRKSQTCEPKFEMFNSVIMVYMLMYAKIECKKKKPTFSFSVKGNVTRE